MHHKILTLTFPAATLTLVGCQSGVTNIPVSRGSETGQAISRLDDTERQYNKNVAAYRQAMTDYEGSHGGKCGTIFFSSLVGPQEAVGPRVRIYKLQGSSKGCGYQNYKVKISYEEDACFVVKTVEILERMTP